MFQPVRFTVWGVPVAEGSMRAFVVGRHAMVTHDNKPKLGPYRQAVAAEARKAMGDIDPTGAAVHVACTFTLPRPTSHFLPVNSRRPYREVKVAAPISPITKPDIDKLARSVLDALTGAVFHDDSQVVSLTLVKLYGTPATEVSVEAADVG